MIDQRIMGGGVDPCGEGGAGCDAGGGSGNGNDDGGYADDYDASVIRTFGPPCRVCVSSGDAYIMDSRALHRGSANQSDR